MIDYTFKNFGTLDILINNAGVLDNFAPVAEVTDECINKVIAVDIQQEKLLMNLSTITLKVILLI